MSHPSTCLQTCSTAVQLYVRPCARLLLVYEYCIIRWERQRVGQWSQSGSLDNHATYSVIAGLIKLL